MKRNNAKKEAEKKVKTQTAWRFYRSNLSTYVWDPDKDAVMADFSKGHCTTKDKKVVKKLRELGYIEIDLNATQPPNIIVNQPTRILKDGAHIPIIGKGANESMAEHRMDAITEEVKAPEVRA